MKLSFVIPVYDERETLAPLLEGILEHAPDTDVEIVFIDDGSTDGSTDVLRELAAKDDRVRVISLDGNRGKSIALAAGFDAVTGDIVFTMDSDLQDDPAEIPQFLAKLEEGYDVVCGWKAVRHDPWHKTIPSHVYNWVVSRMFTIPVHDVNCGYKLLRAEVVKNTHVYGELHRLVPILAQDLGYKIGEIPVKHNPRRYGHSKFGLERFSRGALDVLTLWLLQKRMRAPGHFFGKIALAEFILAAVCTSAAAYAWSQERLGIAIGAGVAAVVLVGTGFGVFAIGLMLEYMLKHFVRIDPQHYAAHAQANHSRDGGNSEP